MSFPERFMTWFACEILPWFFVLMLFGVFLYIPCCFYHNYTEAKKPTFELKKDEWGCAKFYEYTTTTYIMVGKVMVPQTITHKDCIQWNHI